jgi:hypothetical protein
MRKILILFLGMLVSAHAIAQTPNDILAKIVAEMKKFERDYRCVEVTIIDSTGKEQTLKANTVSDYSFNTLFDKAANRIMGASDDVIQNGKGAVLEINEALKKITLSHNWKKKNSEVLNTFGVTGEDASKKFFEFFGNSGWKTSFQISLGQSRQIGAKKIYFNRTACENLQAKRLQYYSDILREYEIVLSTPERVFCDLEKQKDAYEAFKLDSNTPTSNFPTNLTEEEEKLLFKRNMLLKVINSGNPDYTTLFKDSIGKFEEKNFENYGYELFWVNYNFSAGLSKFSIYDTLNTSTATVESKTLPRVALTVSINGFQEASFKRILFGSLQGSIGNTNFLDELQASEITEIKNQNPNNSNIIKEEYNALILNDYGKKNSAYIFTSLGFVGNYFPGNFLGMGRFIGIEAGASIKMKFFEPSEIIARDLLNLHAGLLFTLESKKITKTTFGIIARLTNMPSTKIIPKDYFNIGFRIGVPFNY